MQKEFREEFFDNLGGSLFMAASKLSPLSDRVFLNGDHPFRPAMCATALPKTCRSVLVTVCIAGVCVLANGFVNSPLFGVFASKIDSGRKLLSTEPFAGPFLELGR